MEPIKPIRRHPSLQPLSRDHHDALMLCLKLRKGVLRGVDAGRMAQYARWVFENQLEPHFNIEEEFVFPVLGNDHPLIVEALKQHAELRSIFKLQKPASDVLILLADMLESHIRFEERVLFQAVQESATPLQLIEIEQSRPSERSCETWGDRFWLETN